MNDTSSLFRDAENIQICSYINFMAITFLFPKYELMKNREKQKRKIGNVVLQQ